jgi:hypothetical protein
MKGWIYRRAIALKDFGERSGINFVRDAGLTLMDLILRKPAAGFIGNKK